MNSSTRSVIATGCLIGLVAEVVLKGDPYEQLIISRVLALGLVAVAVHQLSATTRLASLGHGAFFGAGAYTAAFLASHDFTDAPLELLAGALAGALAAAIAGLALIRLRGLSYLVASLTIGLLAASVASSWRGLTGGSDGITAPAATLWGNVVGDPSELLAWTFVIAAVVITAVIWHRRSLSGMALTGIGDSETRMRALGYPIGFILWRAHVSSGAIAGAAGALWIHATGYIAPHDLGLSVGAIALAAAAIAERSGPLTALVATAPLLVARDYADTYLPTNHAGVLWFAAILVFAAYLPVLRRNVPL